MAIQNLDKSNIKEFISSKPVAVVEVFAPWCPHCKRFGPVFDAVAEEIGSGAAFGRVNSDENAELVDNLGVSGYPTVLYFKDSKFVDSVPGEAEKDSVVNKLKGLGA